MKRILGVAGQIMNETGKVIEIPLLKAVLIGAKGEDISAGRLMRRKRGFCPVKR